MIVISDNSSITTLLQIDKSHLLRQLYHEVLIPKAVERELAVLHASLPDFIRCVPVSSQSEVKRLLEEIDDGEAEAIVLAKEQKADVLLLDETEARLVAEREGVHFIGLIGVLIEAKKRGCISSLRDTLQRLESETNFYISETLIISALKNAHEL